MERIAHQIGDVVNHHVWTGTTWVPVNRAPLTQGAHDTRQADVGVNGHSREDASPRVRLAKSALLAHQILGALAALFLILSALGFVGAMLVSGSSSFVGALLAGAAVAIVGLALFAFMMLGSVVAGYIANRST